MRPTLDAPFDLNFETVQNLESQKLDNLVFWHLSDLNQPSGTSVIVPPSLAQ